MDTYVWYVISQEQKGLCYAFAFRIRGNVNIVSFCQRFPDIDNLTMNACKTKKDAVRIAKAWNEQYKANGTYMFSEENILKMA